MVYPNDADPLVERARSQISEFLETLVELAGTRSSDAGSPERVYTLQEAAEHLRQSPSTIGRLRRAGKLRAIPYRGRVVITASELRRFLAARDGEEPR